MSIGTNTVSSGIRFDVEGRMGAEQYCNENGDNCYSIEELMTAGSDTMTGLSCSPGQLVKRISGSWGCADDSTGVGGSNWSQSGNNVYYTSGDVGIGHSGNPLAPLHIQGGGEMILSDSAPLAFDSSASFHSEDVRMEVRGWSDSLVIYHGDHELDDFTDWSLEITNNNAVAIQSSGASDNLKLDVDNRIGADRYCEADGSNCRTSTQLSAINRSDTLNALSCSNQQIAKFNGSNWACAQDEYAQVAYEPWVIESGHIRYPYYVDIGGPNMVQTANVDPVLFVGGGGKVFIDGPSASLDLYGGGRNDRLIGAYTDDGRFTFRQRRSGEGSRGWLNLYHDHARFGDNNGVSSGTINVASNVKADSFPTSSDIRLKKDITPVENAIEKVKRLKGVQFLRIADDSKGIGFIAQEVEKVLPEVVLSPEDNGIKSIDYPKMTALLIEGIKEQQEELKTIASEKSDYEVQLEEKIMLLEAILEQKAFDNLPPELFPADQSS
jgi:hypothetical protein